MSWWGTETAEGGEGEGEGGGGVVNEKEKEKEKEEVLASLGGGVVVVLEGESAA